MAPEIVDQAPSAPVTSRTQASCGRIVHVHMPKLYGDVRPAIVLSATDLNGVEENKIRCNVEFDDQVDYGTGPEASEAGRIGVKHRTVLCNLYDPLTDEQRQFLACSLECWAEWMPYQKGQAAKTDELTPRVAKLETMVGSSESWVRLQRLETVLGKYLTAAGANELAAELKGVL